MMPGVVVMRVGTLHLDHNGMAARSSSAWNGPPVLRIGVGQNDCPVSERDASAMPAGARQLGEAEGLTQPVKGLTHVGINEFRRDAGGPRCTTDQHAASSATGTALILSLNGRDWHCPPLTTARSL
jgi:hypothetical protein